MTVPMSVHRRPKLPWWRRPPAQVAVAAAWLLARQSPRRIRAVLLVVRTGARPADYATTQRMRDAVLATSDHCAGEGCLQRSLATALLCRLHGAWPSWCTGVRTQPFGSHAWVEAEGKPVDEPYPAGYFRPMIVVE